MDAGKYEQADTPDHERVGLADVCQQAIQYETPVAEGCGSQLWRLLFRSGGVRGRAGVYQSSLRLQQHTAAFVRGARLSERRICGTQP